MKSILMEASVVGAAFSAVFATVSALALAASALSGAVAPFDLYPAFLQWTVAFVAFSLAAASLGFVSLDVSWP